MRHLVRALSLLSLLCFAHLAQAADAKAIVDGLSLIHI